MGAQKRRVLRALQHHPQGLTRVDFMAPNVVDGGNPILNFPARIKELRDDGHDIIHDGERYSCHVFKLRWTLDSALGKTAPVPERAPLQDSAQSRTSDTDEPKLFDLGPRRPASPYDEDAA